VANKETIVQSTVSEDIVRRDLDFMPVRNRARLGLLYVPVLRLSIIQLEVTRTFLVNEYLEAVRVRAQKKNMLKTTASQRIGQIEGIPYSIRHPNA
jgi:hypothetical protein